MKRPAFQFYPGDWRKDANLRRCSPAARGVWMDILCVMHDSDEYGVLRWPLKDVAQAAGASMAHVRELVDKGVLRGSDSRVTQPYIYRPKSGRRLGDPVTLVAEQDGPVWYSGRMVKDEYVRNSRGGDTRFTEGGADAGEHPQAATKKRAADSGSERARLRARVLEKTGGKCYHCSCDLHSAWEIDHLVPRAKGGRHAFANLVPSCISCNQDKSDTMPDDWAALQSSPTARIGESNGAPQGDGSSSSSSSSSSEGESESTDSPPSGKAKRTRKSSGEQSLADWMADLKARGEQPIPDGDPVFEYAQRIRLPDEFLALAWFAFRRRYSKPGAKRYTDWRAVFRQAVERDWLGLWRVAPSGDYVLTTEGHQAQRLREDLRANPAEAAHV